MQLDKAGCKRVPATSLFAVIEKKIRYNDVVITDSGSSFFIGMNMFLPLGVRFITSGGLSSMGYAVAAGIGAWIAIKKRTVAILGDGSFSQCIPELQTIKHYNMPIKMFVINNGGYFSIRNTQKKYFGKYIGESSKTGVSLPSVKKIAKAYGIKYTTSVDIAFSCNVPVVCELLASKDVL